MTESKTKFTAEDIRKIQSEVRDKITQAKLGAELRIKEFRNAEAEEKILEITNKIEQYVRRKTSTYSNSMVFPFDTREEYLVNPVLEKLNHPSLGYKAESIRGKCNCSFSQDSGLENYNKSHDTICNISIINLKVCW